MNIEDALSRFIVSELLLGTNHVGPDENLLSEGMVDSLGMVRLVAYIEETFGHKVPPADFTIENFRTVNVIAAYLKRSLNVAGNAGHGA